MSECVRAYVRLCLVPSVCWMLVGVGWAVDSTVGDDLLPARGWLEGLVFVPTNALDLGTYRG